MSRANPIRHRSAATISSSRIGLPVRGCRRWRSSTIASPAISAPLCSSTCARRSSCPAASIELIKHSQLLESLEDPSYMALINLKPLRGTMLMVADTQLVTSIIESRFGGNGRFPVVDGPARIHAGRAEGHDGASSRPRSTSSSSPGIRSTKFEPEIVRLEINPQFASVATASEVVIVSTFLVKVDNGRGQAHASAFPTRCWSRCAIS